MAYFSRNRSGYARNEIKSAFLKSLPVMAGYITLGTGFGLVCTSSGLSAIGAVVFSPLVFAGSMQFVSVDLILGAASPLSIIFMTIAVNLRHLFYSISMVPRYRGAGKLKPYLEFALTDETFSIVCDGAPEGLDAPRFFFLLSLFNQSYWVLGTILGVTLQSLVHISFQGIEFSMTALFVVTFTDQILNRKSPLSSMLGIVVTLACLLLFGSQRFLIPSLAIIAPVLVVVVITGKDIGKNDVPETSNSDENGGHDG